MQPCRDCPTSGLPGAGAERRGADDGRLPDLAVTLYFSGDFEAARQNAWRGVQLWRAGGIQSRFEEVNSPVVVCLSFEALCGWHFGEIASCQATMVEAISLAKELNDKYALAVALFHAGFAGHFERDPAKVERLASELIELSTRHHFAFWRAAGEVFRGWAQSISGSTAEGIARIEEGIADWRATGSMLIVSYWLALKAEVLHLADIIFEALEAIEEAEELAALSEERWWCAELHRLRGVFLTAMGAAQAQIETSFCEAIRTAREQKSVSLINAPKSLWQNIAGKRRTRQEDVNSDYLFDNFLQFSDFRLTPCPRNPSPFSANPPHSSNRTFLAEIASSVR